MYLHFFRGGWNIKIVLNLVILRYVYLYISEKFNLEDQPHPKESTSTDSKKKKYSFKYIKHTQVKAVHQRLLSFVRYIDLMMMDLLRTLTVSAVSMIQQQVEASSKLQIQPYFRSLSTHQSAAQREGTVKVRDSLRREEATVKAVPTFEVLILLNTDTSSRQRGLSVLL